MVDSIVRIECSRVRHRSLGTQREERNPVTTLDNLSPQIWDASPFPVVVTDYATEPKQRKIVYVNSAFTGLTGFAAVEVVGKPVTLIDGPRTDPNRTAECEATLK